MKYLKEEEVKIRNKIIRESWQRYKGLSQEWKIKTKN